jgi:hypothetical protein
MTATLTPPQPTQPGAPTSAAAQDWARALLERQLWILGQLAEGGLEFARAIERQATSGEAGKEGVPAAAAMAYARVARAVRLTILLQSKLIADLQTLESKAANDAYTAHCRRALDQPRLEREQKARIGRIVGRVAWAEGREHAEIQRMARHAAEMLDHDDHFGDILTRPVSEIIALICRDLGLEPDWPKLAEEAWAQAEIKSGAAGEPLAAVMAASWPARARNGPS